MRKFFKTALSFLRPTKPVLSGSRAEEDRPEPDTHERMPIGESPPHVHDFAHYLLDKNDLLDKSACNRIIVIGGSSAEALTSFAAKGNLTCVGGFGGRHAFAERFPSSTYVDWSIKRDLPDLGDVEGALIVCSNIVQYLLSPKDFLKALAKLARHAAYVVVSTPDRARTHGLLENRCTKRADAPCAWTAHEFGSAMLEAGFSRNIFIGFTTNHRFTKSNIFALAGRHAEFVSQKKRVSVAAIIRTYNEGDVVETVARHLHAQGIEVHVFDNWSTDKTFEILETLVAEGVCKSVERYPDAPTPDYEWTAMLDHTARYSSALEAEWIIHYDADEIRLSPWQDVSLRDAISFVDAMGYSAIDFTVLNFAFVDDTESVSLDPGAAGFFDFGRHPAHLLQVKAWKNTGAVPDIAASGGHDATFEGRRVYPLKFLNKHYPLRSVAQANRKVFRDRLPRVAKEKAEKGWHNHYDAYISTPGIRPWRRFELTTFDEHTFASEFIVERLSGVGIETETRAIVSLDTAFAQSESDAATITAQRKRIEELERLLEKDA